MPKILRYVRGEFDDQTTSYHCTATATPIERYQAHSVMGGSVEGETSGGGGRSHIGPNEIRMIIEALEGCDWVQWVKSRMKRGQALYEADEVDLDVPTERYGRRSVADRLQLGPPSFPGDRIERERYSRPVPRPRPEPLALRLARPTGTVASLGDQIERYTKELAETPRQHYAKRRAIHATLAAADAQYRHSRKEAAERAAAIALEMGIGYEEALTRYCGGMPRPLVGSTP